MKLIKYLSVTNISLHLFHSTLLLPPRLGVCYITLLLYLCLASPSKLTFVIYRSVRVGINHQPPLWPGLEIPPPNPTSHPAAISPLLHEARAHSKPHPWYPPLHTQMNMFQKHKYFNSLFIWKECYEDGFRKMTFVQLNINILRVDRTFRRDWLNFDKNMLYFF